MELLNEQEKKLGRTPTRCMMNGSEVFGFALPEVAMCIEGMDGADQCKNYIFRRLRHIQISGVENIQPMKRNGEENNGDDKRIKEQCF